MEHFETRQKIICNYGGTVCTLVQEVTVNGILDLKTGVFAFKLLNKTICFYIYKFVAQITVIKSTLLNLCVLLKNS